MKVVLLVIFVLWMTKDLANGEWLLTRPTVMKKDAKPVAGQLSDRAAASDLQCAFLCTQDIYCLKYAFNGTRCVLFGPVFPVLNPEWVSAEGYTTYRARKGIFKVINVSYYYHQLKQACADKYGGKPVSVTNEETYELLAQLLKDKLKCGSYMLGLRSVGRSGIFEWNNGATINAENGTGFQRWQPGSKPNIYKTKDSIVHAWACGKNYGTWFETPAGTSMHILCEIS